jgi:hypothetical protein
MATLNDLAARLERLKKLRATGLKSVAHEGAHTEFRSMDELTRAIGYLETEIAQAGGAQSTRTFKVTSSKDL